MTPDRQALEQRASTPTPALLEHFNQQAQLPYGLTVPHIFSTMQGFTDFLGFVNRELHARSLKRLEALLMQANFSSLVGEYMKANIPTFCPTLVANKHHNGHPDLVPVGHYPLDDVEHGTEGIEIKGSRNESGWQGHNAEDCWLMVFVYDSNRPEGAERGIPKPFRFLMVVGARVTQEDWSFSGRNPGSRRTITASILKRGRDKMLTNWIYRAPELSVSAAEELVETSLAEVADEHEPASINEEPSL